jgi:6-phosphofructokinase 1
MADLKRIGVLTGGGDAPGLNAVIRAVVKSAVNAGIGCLGLEDSFDGLLDTNRSRVLLPNNVTGILRIGGTILGTTNRGNPFEYPAPGNAAMAATTGVGRRGPTSEELGGVQGPPPSKIDYSQRCIDTFHRLALDALIVIGGDGTLSIAHRFFKLGIPLVGVPKTIDNDIVGTTNCFGFDTAVSFATEAIDRLHTTAEAHHRVMVVEVMGRYAGWIALHAGLAGGADVILMPEVPFDLGVVAARIREREAWGARFSIVVVAEGAVQKGGTPAIKEAAHGGHVERLGGMGALVACELERLTGKETRDVVLGHLQRGGAPTSCDRLLATRFGGAAVDLARRGLFGMMVASDPPDIVAVPLEQVVGKTKSVPLDSDTVMTARALGVSFGD